MIELTGSRSAIEYRPLPQDDPLQRQPDIAQARQRLGWEPNVPLREGLARTIAYFKGAFRAELGTSTSARQLELPGHLSNARLPASPHVMNQMSQAERELAPGPLSADPTLSPALDTWRTAGRELIVRQLAEFNELLDPIEPLLWRNNFAAAAAAAQVAANYAAIWHPGIFTSARLEKGPAGNRQGRASKFRHW